MNFAARRWLSRPRLARTTSVKRILDRAVKDNGLGTLPRPSGVEKISGKAIWILKQPAKPMAMSNALLPESLGRLGADINSASVICSARLVAHCIDRGLCQEGVTVFACLRESGMIQTKFVEASSRSRRLGFQPIGNCAHWRTQESARVGSANRIDSCCKSTKQCLSARYGESDSVDRVGRLRCRPLINWDANCAGKTKMQCCVASPSGGILVMAPHRRTKVLVRRPAHAFEVIVGVA